MPVDDTKFNIERCNWHAERLDKVDEAIAKLERNVYTQNGTPGLIEAVRAMARIQRWHTIALIALLLLQLGEPAQDFLKYLLKSFLG